LLLLKSTDSLLESINSLKTGKAWHLCLNFVSVFALAILFTVILQSPWIPKRTKHIFMTINWNHMELSSSQWGQLSQEFSQTGTRLLPPGDNLPELDQTTRPPSWPRLQALPVMKPTRPYLWLNCLTKHTFCPLLPVLLSI
jgi:hypothetical protein